MLFAEAVVYCVLFAECCVVVYLSVVLPVLGKSEFFAECFDFAERFPVPFGKYIVC